MSDKSLSKLRSLHQLETRNPKYISLAPLLYFGLALWIVLSTLLWFVIGEFSIIVSISIIGVIVVWFQMQLYYRTQNKNFQHYRQLEAHISLMHLIKINHPLPPMRLWAISPDVATVIFSQITIHHPKVVLELGSGISTLVSAYSAKQANLDTKIYAIDHEKDFWEISSDHIRNHGLSERVTIIHAPLQQITINDYVGQWYNPSVFEEIEPIDLLFIDGPPGILQPLSRYPALPLLYDKLCDGAIIILDDYARDDEYEIVKNWIQAFDVEVIKIIDNEKGAIVLQKRIPPSII